MEGGRLKSEAAGASGSQCGITPSGLTVLKAAGEALLPAGETWQGDAEVIPALTGTAVAGDEGAGFGLAGGLKGQGAGRLPVGGILHMDS